LLGWNPFGRLRRPARPLHPAADAIRDLEDRVARLERQTKLSESYLAAAIWRVLDVAYAASLPHRRLRCIVCDHESPPDGFEILTDTCVFGGGRLERYRCPICDCVFGPQKILDLDESFVSRDYELLYSRYSEADNTADEIRTFRSVATAPGVYLDWGCGGVWSRAVSALRAEGWDVWGYEPSAPKPGDFVVNSRDEISGKFDGLFSNNVIEHFREPVAQFRDFHGLLKPGALMAHASPCYDYSYTYTRFHTLFLLGRSPEVLAKRTGFEIVDVIRDGQYVSHVFRRIQDQ
jgi:hypothetical protein